MEPLNVDSLDADPSIYWTVALGTEQSKFKKLVNLVRIAKISTTLKSPKLLPVFNSNSKVVQPLREGDLNNQATF